MIETSKSQKTFEKTTPVSQNRVRKKLKKRSAILRHCIIIKNVNNGKENDVIKCNHCTKTYLWGGSSSNMKIHLRNMH